MNAPPTILFRHLNLPLRLHGGRVPLNNPDVPGHEYAPAVTALTGGFAALWSIAGEIRARLFNADGAPIGGEIAVNTQTAGVQVDQRLAALAGGGFVVSWLDFEGDAGTGTHGHFAVKAQVFSAAGAKLGAEILVNSAINGSQGPVAITALANGNFLAVWDDGYGGVFGPSDGSLGVGGAGGDSSGAAVKAQLFAADGSRIGGEMLVNTTTQNAQHASSATALADGGFAILWYDSSVSPNTNVVAQFFAASGAKIGSEILFNPVGRYVYGASIATLANGNVLVSWNDYTTGENDLQGQLLTAGGVKIGDAFAIASGPEDQRYGRIGVLADGGFVAAWQLIDPNHPGDYTVVAQLFGPDGFKIDDEVRILHETLSDMVVFANGEIAILSATHMRLFNSHLHNRGDFVVDTAGAVGGVWDLAATPDGRMMMVATTQNIATTEYDVFARFAALEGSPQAVETEPLDLKREIVIGDPDAGAGSLTVTLSVATGILDVAAGGSGAMVAGSGTGTVTITGTLAQINALLTSDSASVVAFVAIHDSAPSVTLTVAVNDNGNAGGGAQSATAGLGLAIVAAPDVTYVGTAGPDNLVGGDGDDIFVGYTGNDTMTGRGGSDTYYVDDAGDVVVEPVSYGVDRVATSVSYALPADADIEIFEAVNLDRIDAMDLIGNGFAQTIIGNYGTNILKGNGGDDVLVGGGGNDYLVGGPGNDAMYGGIGNDTYYVDAAGDLVIEAANQGLDRVAASASYTLAAGAEVEVLEAVTPGALVAMDLTGNGFANAISGNSAVNILRGEGGNDSLAGYGGDDYLVGGAGSDAMYGGLGNDTYYVESAGDTVSEAVGEGSDRISTSLSLTLAAGVEIETLEAANLGGTEAFSLIGNEFANNVIGNAGANTIDGKGGFDVLVGAGGADLFAFTAPLGASNVDRIADFVSGTDRIGLEDTVFLSLALGPVPANVFVVGAQAQEADDRLVYNAGTGQLYFDFDGNGPGSAILFAILDGHPPLAAGDFIVI